MAEWGVPFRAGNSPSSRGTSRHRHAAATSAVNVAPPLPVPPRVLRRTFGALLGLPLQLVNERLSKSCDLAFALLGQPAEEAAVVLVDCGE